MISYKPLWETLQKKNITTYKLIKDYNISRGMLDNLKHNRNVTVETIGRLCDILDCQVEDVMIYRKELEVYQDAGNSYVAEDGSDYETHFNNRNKQ